MLSHLKAQNRHIENGIRTVEQTLKKLADASLDEKGRCRIQYGPIGMHVVADAEHNLLVVKAFTNFLPDPNSGKVLPLYYHLLDMNDAPQTGLAYYSIVASEEIGLEQDVISVETKRPIAGVSHEEFIACLEAVGEVAQTAIAQLAEKFDAPPIP
ncbi:MAG: hypothetical protein IT326_02125 [Anaerolineae bacterium]|nr:hypothetical protein [Anaerolineae bacterium]